MPIVRLLARPHVSIHGAPTLGRVDTSIFVRRYFTRCMDCAFCADACCRHGVDVDEPNVRRILTHASTLEATLGVPRSEWFDPGFTVDPEHPGGKHTRTRVRDGYCVFHSRSGRGCALHAHALERGFDYHDIKPMVSALFPLTFDDGLLHPSNEVEDGTLVCAGTGPTLYRGARDELRHYFGQPLIDELDGFEGEC
jgi:Fe-S-cluster containining protein